MKRFYVIPIFIPEKACPFRCVYCNQYHITEHSCSVEPEDVKEQIERYLETIPPYATVRVGFFGGSFTGMPIVEQNRYLDVVQPYIENGIISEIQLSTRPDYINEEILQNLLEHHVTTIELGAQSLDDEVLRLAGRGHTAAEVERAAVLIKSYHFKLGLQMMLGLPGDTRDKALRTARRIVELGAQCTRIYPTLVIKDTELETMYRKGKYVPLTMEEAVEVAADVMEVFEQGGVQILRVGLHPSEGLIRRETLVAGPFHVSFKELVETERWRRRLVAIIGDRTGEILTLTVHPHDVNALIGYGGTNRKWLEERFRQVIIQQEYETERGKLKIEN